MYRIFSVYACTCLIVLLPLTKTESISHLPLILEGLAVIVLLSYGGDKLLPDFTDGHLAWRLSHGYSASRYLLTHIGSCLWTTITPLTLVFFSIQWAIYPLPKTLLLTGSFIITCLTTISWGLLLALVQGRFNQSWVGLMVAPLTIPQLLFSENLVYSLADFDQARYYLGMQGGLSLMSLAISIALAPVVIRNLDW